MFLSHYDKCSLSEDFSVNLHPKCVSVVMVWNEHKKERKKKIIIDGLKQDENWHCYKMAKNPPPGKDKLPP